MLKSIVIEDIIDAIEQSQSISQSTDYENVTQETLETAGKMFTYLSLCPPNTHKFYYDLFTDESPKNIILAIISMLKTTRNANKISSDKIFLNVAEKLKINNHYRNIKDLTSANCTTSCNEILNVLGRGSFKKQKNVISFLILVPDSPSKKKMLKTKYFFSICSMSHRFMPKNVLDNFC